MFLPELTKRHQVVLLDFLDQGQSDRLEEDYTQALQVDVVLAVVNHLDLKSFSLFGISYGGEVALQFALTHKKRLDHLLLFNTTAYTNPWLDDIGNGWIRAAELRDKELFYNATIPIIYSPMFYTKNIQWMNDRKAVLYDIFTDDFLDGMIRLTKSASSHNVKEKLPELDGLKTLVVGSDYDFITPDFEQTFIHEKIASSQLFIIKECGHASMYEKPEAFLTLIKGFLNN